MRLLLVATLLVGCSARAAQPIATPAPTVEIVRQVPTTHVFDPRSFTVGVFDADESAGVTQAVFDSLPASWSTATGGRSSLSFVAPSAVPDIYVYFGAEMPATVRGGVQSGWELTTPTLRFIYVHRLSAATSTSVLIHELGHAIGCCSGAGTDSTDPTHWTDCPTPPVEIMCHFQGTATTFSERELRAMGL